MSMSIYTELLEIKYFNSLKSLKSHLLMNLGTDSGIEIKRSNQKKLESHSR